jgi:hypothetical protein
MVTLPELRDRATCRARAGPQRIAYLSARIRDPARRRSPDVLLVGTSDTATATATLTDATTQRSMRGASLQDLGRPT